MLTTVIRQKNVYFIYVSYNCIHFSQHFITIILTFNTVTIFAFNLVLYFIFISLSFPQLCILFYYQPKPNKTCDFLSHCFCILELEHECCFVSKIPKLNFSLCHKINAIWNEDFPNPFHQLSCFILFVRSVGGMFATERKQSKQLQLLTKIKFERKDWMDCEPTFFIPAICSF